MGDDYRRDSGDHLNSLTYLLIGGGIGAILALLFAPKSGQELRGDIADATRKGIDRSREAAQQFGDRAGEYYEATRGRAAELYSQASEKVGEVAQTAREAASARPEPLPPQSTPARRLIRKRSARPNCRAALKPLLKLRRQNN
jgi:gas vesicle protein